MCPEGVCEPSLGTALLGPACLLGETKLRVRWGTGDLHWPAVGHFGCSCLDAYIHSGSSLRYANWEWHTGLIWGVNVWPPRMNGAERILKPHQALQEGIL